MNIVTDQATQLCCQSLFLFLDTILFRVSIRNSSHQHIEVLSKTVPKPVLPKDCKDSVLVRVHAVGLNPVDAKQVSGDKLPQGYMRKFFHKAVVRDTVIGFDFSGVVEESNNGCEYKAGDQVFGTVPPLYGSLQEYIVVPTHHIYRKPSSLTTVEAAALPLVGLTAYQALRPHAGESTSIVVLGASSGTGHMVLQVAERLGFTTRIAVCSGKNMSCGPTALPADTLH